MKLQAILLAGGTGSRFGSQKLAHTLPDGTPIGRQSALNLIAAIDNVLIVHRPEDEPVVRIFAGLPVTFLAAERCHEGMGGSLASAVAATADAAGWIVALADMPFIQPESILAVRRALEAGASIAVPSVEGRRGHPVGFSAAWRDALSGLAGDEGARRIVAAQGDAVSQLLVDDAGILRDVDVPGDLAERSAAGEASRA